MKSTEKDSSFQLEVDIAAHIQARKVRYNISACEALSVAFSGRSDISRNETAEEEMEREGMFSKNYNEKLVSLGRQYLQQNPEFDPSTPRGADFVEKFGGFEHTKEQTRSDLQKSRSIDHYNADGHHVGAGIFMGLLPALAATITAVATTKSPLSLLTFPIMLAGVGYDSKQRAKQQMDAIVTSDDKPRLQNAGYINQLIAEDAKRSQIDETVSLFKGNRIELKNDKHPKNIHNTMTIAELFLQNAIAAKQKENQVTYDTGMGLTA